MRESGGERVKGKARELERKSVYVSGRVCVCVYV